MGGQLTKEETGTSTLNPNRSAEHIHIGPGSSCENESLSCNKTNESIQSVGNKTASKLNEFEFYASLRKVLGNTGNLSTSARKMFSLVPKLLYEANHDVTINEGFPALFQALTPSKTAGLEFSKEDQARSMRDAQSQSDSYPGRNETISNVIHSNTQRTLKETNKSYSHGSFLPHFLNSQCAQTYNQWKARHDLGNLNTLCFSSPNRIYLQPLDTFPGFFSTFKLHTRNLTLGFFETLQAFMQIYFSGMEIIIQPAVMIQQTSWKIRSRCHVTTGQKQYCVTDLFPSLQTLLPRNGHSIVGLIWTDLYPEDFNFVLGEASYAHKSAVISFGRFETKNFDAMTHQDITNIDGQIIWKLFRTLSHEICHIFGLDHCVYFHCAMNESTSVAEALDQPLFLCPVCLRKLQQACGFDVLDRYQLLLEFLRSVNHQFPDSNQFCRSLDWLENCVQFLKS